MYKYSHSCISVALTFRPIPAHLLYKYNHLCFSVALDFNRDNWILLDFSSKDDAEASCKLLNEASTFNVFTIDHEGDFINTVNRISLNRLHSDKHFIHYARLNNVLSTIGVNAIYSKLVQAMIKKA